MKFETIKELIVLEQNSIPKIVVIYCMTFFQGFSNKTEDVGRSFSRKNLLCGYILGVPKHSTAWDQHWGDDEILK